MKNKGVVSMVAGLLLVYAVTASAASGNNSQAPQGGDQADQRRVPYVSVQRGAQTQDIRIFRPDMTVHERLLVQRDLKRRAFARRNALMQAAESERRAQRANAPAPVQPGMTQ